MAARIGHLERVRELLDADRSLANRVSENLFGAGSPLQNAVGSGHMKSSSCSWSATRIRICPRKVTRRTAVRCIRPSTTATSTRPNWLGVTPLHRFAEHGDVENAAIFIDHGADLHARDEDLCSTPLGYAARFGKTRMVEFLLRRGAPPTLPDDPPWATPLAWATRRGHDEIVRLLIGH